MSTPPTRQQHSGPSSRGSHRRGQAVERPLYDDENRLVQWVSTNEFGQGNLTQFTYDGLGRLRQRLEFSNFPSIPPPGQPGADTPNPPPAPWVLDSETDYIYDGFRVIQERDMNNVPTVSYTRGNDLSGSLEGAGGIGGLLARSDGYAGGNFSSHTFYHADGNGNVTYIVDGSQALAASYRYDPFGNIISQSGPLADANVYRFSSKEIHAFSGMYYYLYRFYDPNLQRWINRDPIQEWGGINLYAFVGNAPVNLVDSFGEYMSFWHFLGTELGEFYRGNFLGAIPVAAQSVLADFRPGSQGTDAAHANRHAMAGLLPNGCYQTADEARKATENYINDRLAQYRQDHRWWNPFSGSQALGDAYHAIQDSYASGHNYQEWHGGIPSPSHIAGDFLGVPPLFPVVNRISHGLE